MFLDCLICVILALTVLPILALTVLYLAVGQQHAADARRQRAQRPLHLGRLYYGEHGVERREREERERGEREREEAPLALRATRPQTVGYIGVCDQAQGVIECPSNH